MKPYVNTEWEDLKQYYLIVVNGKTEKRCQYMKDAERYFDKYKRIFPKGEVSIVRIVPMRYTL